MVNHLRLFSVSLLVFALLCSSALAQQPQVDFPGDSGNAFVRLCSGMDKEVTRIEIQHAIACIAYVNGLADGVSATISYAQQEKGVKVAAPFCLPSEVENDQQSSLEVYSEPSGDRSPSDCSSRFRSFRTSISL